MVCGAPWEHCPWAPLGHPSLPSPTPVGTVPMAHPGPAEGTWLVALPSPERPAHCHQH